MFTNRPRGVPGAFFLVLAIASFPHADHAAGTGGGGMFGDVNISAILDSLSISYDKRVRPNYGGPPVDVGVTMYVLSISSLSEVKMDFTLDFYFRQFWTDPRLAYKKRPGVETLSVGSEFIKNIWVPDTFFVNEKQSYFHIATTSNEFIRIHYSGSITRSIRLTITASCPMDLQYFPMDRQLCNIEIESFGYTMRDIRYKWNEGPNSVGVSNEVSLPQFKVLGHRQRAMEISLTTGNYSRLACEIQFVRSMGYYLIQIYIPSGLIVIISWVSFWLNRNATPARVSLGVTTVLTMTTLMSSTNAALPKISYVKSIDVYLGTCFVMVFASLLEYATVGYLAKRIQMRKQRFTAVQKIAAEAAEKKIQVVSEAAPPPPPQTPQPPPVPLHHGHLSHVELGLHRPGDLGHQSHADIGHHRNVDLGHHSLAELGHHRSSELGHHSHADLGHHRNTDLDHHSHADLGHHRNTELGHHSLADLGHHRDLGHHSHADLAHHRNIELGQHSHADLSHHSHAEPVPPPRTATLSRPHPPRSSEVRFKVHDTKAFAKGTTMENTHNIIKGVGVIEEEAKLPPPHLIQASKGINKILGVTPSDIDKYSRIVFPVCFVCFNLMYWIIYLHVSDVVADDLVLLGED